MKLNIYLIFLFCIIAGNVYSQKNNNTFTINGKLKNIPDGTIIYLFKDEDGTINEVTIDTDTLKNGSFTLTDTISNTRKLSIIVLDKNFITQYLPVWVAPNSKTTITGSVPCPRLWQTKSNLKIQKEQQAYLNIAPKETHQKLLMDLEMLTLRDKYKAENNATAREAIKKQGMLLEKSIDSLSLITKKMKLEYMKKAPITQLWRNELSSSAESLELEHLMLYREDITFLYNRLSDKEKNSPYGKKIATLLKPIHRFKKGDVIEYAALVDINNKNRNLSEFKGKYILIDFWNRGCGPCIIAFPELHETATRFADILSVVCIADDNHEQWSEFISKQPSNCNHWRDTQSTRGLSTQCNVAGVPTYILLNPKGEIIEEWFGYSKGLIIRQIEKFLPVQ